MLGVIFLWYPDPGGTMTPGASTRANPGLGVSVECGVSRVPGTQAAVALWLAEPECG